ncbi:MAG: response regulator [Novosphingobium sp.]
MLHEAKAREFNPRTSGKPMAGILIVEDEFLVALDLEDILSRAGYSVAGIVSDFHGASAVAQAPRVALVDLNLRDGPTGNAIAWRLAQTFGTSIIFVTANPDQICSPPKTAIGYVQKPFKAESIVRAVRDAIEGQRPVGASFSAYN